MEQELIRLLKEKKLTITTAESCTGGWIAATIVSVPGSSSVFDEAMVTYANEAKMRRLGVSEKTLCEHGAVSFETAFEMAKGACAYARADISLVSTGIAGPDGGTKEKPVGLVYIGCCYLGKVTVKRFVFSGGRNEVRQSAVNEAIALGVSVLKEA